MGSKIYEEEYMPTESALHEAFRGLAEELRKYEDACNKCEFNFCDRAVDVLYNVIEDGDY